MAARTCAGSIAWTLASLNSNLNEGAPPFSAAVRRADMVSPYKPEWREAQWQTALVELEPLVRRQPAARVGVVVPSPARHCHTTLALAVIDCHSLGITHLLILLSLLPFSAQMAAPPGGWQCPPPVPPEWLDTAKSS